jgi:hypothetical protein
MGDGEIDHGVGFIHLPFILSRNGGECGDQQDGEQNELFHYNFPDIDE